MEEGRKKARTADAPPPSEAAGAAAAIVFFWKPETTNGYLGNWFPAPYTMPEGHRVPTSEHHFMWRKAMFVGDEDRAARILKSKTPAGAKKLGRQVQPWDEAQWAQVREQVMYEVCLAKFRAHPKLAAQLLETQDALLAEASPYDKTWGIGVAATDRKATQPDQWPGANLLGKVLMRVREEMKNSQSPA